MTGLLSVLDLTVAFRTEDGPVLAVDKVSFTMAEREVLALVGESGCGKSVTAMALSKLLPRSATISGSVALAGAELLELRQARLRDVRGRDIAYVFQEPMTSLNPVLTVGRQIGEVLRRHQRMRGSAVTRRAAELLELVGIPLPDRRLREYPHQLSGGMRQRVMIAMAVACRPKLLVADEPTTALDVTVQAGILDVLRDLRAETGTAILLITHDLGVVADVADRVVVMYAGRCIEEAGTDALFARHQHPYTHGLLDAVPNPARHADGGLREIPGRVPTMRSSPTACTFAERCGYADDLCRTELPPFERGPQGHPVRCFHPLRQPDGAVKMTPSLEVVDLVKHFGAVRAVDGVSLSVAPGEVLGLVGESGSGKSTLGRCVTRLVPVTGGSVRVNGTDISRLSRHKLRPLRRGFNIVFQDPASSLNPRLSVAEIVGEPLRLHHIGDRSTRPGRVTEMLEQVGLGNDVGRRYPHELSGGQRQRVSLARALSAGPALLVADEPTSALDVSVQASVLNLIGRLQAELGFACLFITHDLAAVEFLAQRVAVMYLGVLVEVADRQSLFAGPRHPYTQALLSAALIPDPVIQRTRQRVVLSGEVPSPVDPPSGCRFHPRCPVAVPECARVVPPLRQVGPKGELVACHLVQDDGSGPRLT